MSDDAAPDLRFVARQLRDLVSQVEKLCDDTAVLMAVSRRLEGSVSRLANEVRAGASEP